MIGNQTPRDGPTTPRAHHPTRTRRGGLTVQTGLNTPQDANTPPRPDTANTPPGPGSGPETSLAPNAGPSTPSPLRHPHHMGHDLRSHLLRAGANGTGHEGHDAAPFQQHTPNTPSLERWRDHGERDPWSPASVGRRSEATPTADGPGHLQHPHDAATPTRSVDGSMTVDRKSVV